MSPDLRQSLDLDNFDSKPSKNSDLPSIEDIFVAKRSYDFVLHTQPAQGCFFHFWAPKCSGGCPDNSQTPWSHRISPRRDPRSEPAQIQLLGILAPWDSTIFAQKISLRQLWWLSTEPHAFLMLKQVIYKIDQLMGVVGWSESLWILQVDEFRVIQLSD